MLADRYLPTRLLGRGGFGAAFLACDRYIPETEECVVKQFLPSSNLTAEQLKMAQMLFRREGQVLRQLGVHPQIPDLKAFFPLTVQSRIPGETEQLFYLVQEFVDGETLEEELERKGKFSEADIRHLLEQILPVLQYVHDNGSIHRDIKPSNIMRRRDGLLFLLDFGAVKKVTAGAAAGNKAQTGIYSMGFAPPEQMQREEVYPSTDLYALAVTCVMLLTQQQPRDLYDAYSNTWSWRNHTQVSDRLEGILNRMLQANPRDRFQSATEVLGALQPPPPPPAPAPTPSPATFPSPAPTPAPTPAPASAPKPIPVPSAPKPIPVPRPAKPRSPRSPFSLPEFIAEAGFTGFEGGLLAIATASLLGTSATPIFWLVLTGIVGVMVFAQSRRWIEKVDLVLIAIASLAIVVLLPLLHHSLGDAGGLVPLLQTILPIVVLAGLGAIAVGLIFRLIYTLLSRWM